MEFWWPFLIPFVVIIIVILCLIYRCCCTSTERRNARRDPLNRDHEKGILSDEELATESSEDDCETGLLSDEHTTESFIESSIIDKFLTLNKNNNILKKIDLHKFNCKEVTIILDRYLPPSLSYRQRFEVVTGRGNNSVNGEAVLFPYVKKELDAIYPKNWIRAINKNGSWIITGGDMNPQERVRR